MTKLLWLLVAVLLVIGVSTMPVAAQVTTSFSAVAQALQSALTSATAAMNATSPAAGRAGLSAAQGSLQTAASILTTIQNTATDDATRSRASGLLAHVNAALGSIQQGLTGPDVEVTSRANAAFAEIQEALSEIPPVPSVSPSPVPSVAPSPVPVPTALPPTGSPASSIWLTAMAAAGGLFLLSGRLVAQRRARKLAAAQRGTEQSLTRES